MVVKFRSLEVDSVVIWKVVFAEPGGFSVHLALGLTPTDREEKWLRFEWKANLIMSSLYYSVVPVFINIDIYCSI